MSTIDIEMQALHDEVEVLKDKKKASVDELKPLQDIKLSKEVMLDE